MKEPLFLGIEIGGTKLQLGIGSGNRQLTAFAREQVDPGLGAEGILAQIGRMYESLQTGHGMSDARIGAVGVGFGGPVDVERGVIITSHQISGWDGFDLAGWIKRTLGIALVSLHNDADTAGLAEARLGAGLGSSPVLYVTIGSGIGGGLVIDGNIYRGAGSGAVEIGHLWIHSDDQLDPTPRQLEQIASGWAIASRAARLAQTAMAEGRLDEPLVRAVDGDPHRISAKAVAAAAAEGDAVALAVLETALNALAQGLAHAITLLAPKRVILGGGVSLIAERIWLDPLHRKLDQLVFGPFRNQFQLVRAALGEKVVVHGALCLARDAFFQRDHADVT
jgi:glucokinase